MQNCQKVCGFKKVRLISQANHWLRLRPTKFISTDKVTCIQVSISSTLLHIFMWDFSIGIHLVYLFQDLSMKRTLCLGFYGDQPNIVNHSKVHVVFGLYRGPAKNCKSLKGARCVWALWWTSQVLQITQKVYINSAQKKF